MSSGNHPIRAQDVIEKDIFHVRPIEEWERLLAAAVFQWLKDDHTGHDLQHILRVRRFALRIGKAEQLDSEVLVAASYIHDIGRLEESQGGRDHVEIAMVEAVNLLKSAGFPDGKTDDVLRCIRHHEDYPSAGALTSLPREVGAFQDADRLDAMGAIGLARTLMFGGAHRLPLWMPSVKPKKWHHGQTSAGSINHVHDKLLDLIHGMNTNTARQLAASRHQFMQVFLQEFEDEWEGKE